MTRRSAKTLEELRHGIGDMLELSLSDEQMVQALLKRANDIKLLLRAALSVARGRETDRIAQLEQQLDDAVLDRDELEGELLELCRKFDALITDMQQKVFPS